MSHRSAACRPSVADAPSLARRALQLLAPAALAALVACQTPPPAPPAAPAPLPADHSVKVEQPVPPAPPPDPPPLPPANVQRLLSSALELLEQGNPEQAGAELQRVLHIEPSHRLARDLTRQITADPVATLGRESFPYRVQAGESLSRIAQRFLGDLHLFYMLARYNDIKVPRQISGGQLIRIPGKAPQPVAVVSAAATPRPLDAVRAERESTEHERPQRIWAAMRSARAAFARQDLAAAIESWDVVLEIDPGHAAARHERQRALELKARLTKASKPAAATPVAD